jgi:hypothetical protein
MYQNFMDPQHRVRSNDHLFKGYFFSPRKVQGASVAKSSDLSKDVKQWQKQQLEGNLALLSSSLPFILLTKIICTGEPAVQAIPLPGPAVSEHKFFCQLCKVIHFLFSFNHFHPSCT